MTRPSRRAGYAAAALAAAALIGLGVRDQWRAPPEPDPPARAGGAQAAGERGPTGARRAEAPGRAPGGLPGPGRAPRDDEGEAAGPEGDPRSLWEKRLDRAQRTLDSYLESTRYPPGSRPAREHPDQLRPNHVDAATVPLARPDEKLTDARVTLRQDRFFVVGDQQITFTILCEDSDGPAPCEVTSAIAGVPPSERARGVPGPADVPVSFTSAGQEGVHTATFQPAAQGFGGYHGTLRVSVQLKVDQESGGASFDFQYTPAPPAAFTGRVREALQEGSLDLFVEMTVDRPGRYVLAGRVDDARGQTFAYLSFNEELAAGRQEARLRIFGKLIRDEAPEPPFRLRDVEGFLLKENAHPDRELMAGLLGTVYTTKRYRLNDFSDAAWESEEKTRYVDQLSKDVAEAKGHVDGEAP